MSNYIVLLLAASLWLPLAGQQPARKNYTISGYAREEGSRETLTGVNVHDPSSGKGTVTNAYGFYSITLPANDSLVLVYSYVGFSPQAKLIRLDRDVTINLDLSANLTLDEVEVRADRVRLESESSQMSVVSIPVSQIKEIPALMGEKDVLKVLQLTPGVQSGSEGSSGIYVRGGGPDQNLVILDDAIVYNTSHLFGFFSLFNGDALKSVELIKGGFPARYGGRLSSVVEMSMKEGNKQEFKGEGGIGLISSRLTLEGPVVKDKASFLVSGRRTYLDLIARPLMPENEKFGYYFYDLNTKLNYDLGPRDKVYLSGYFGQDRMYAKFKSSYSNETAGFHWGNATGTARWNHQYNSRMFSNTAFIVSNYEFVLSNEYKVIGEGKDTYMKYSSDIQDFTLKHDIDFLPNPNHWIKAGIISTRHRYRPGAFVVKDDLMDGTPIFNSETTTTYSLESGLYVEDQFKPLPYLKINAGARLSHYLVNEQHNLNLEPRVSLSYTFSGHFAAKASYATMNQYIHLLTNTGIGLPTDLWVPATNKTPPQQSRQYAVGVVKDLPNIQSSISLESYYKSSRQIIGYKEGANFLLLDDVESGQFVDWETMVTPGKSWSYGAELFAQKKAGRFTGWVGYTLSWTWMQFDSINFGNKFPARYDRRHDISIVGTYKLRKNINLSATWVYGTGNAITMATSRYEAYYHRPGETPYNYPVNPGNSYISDIFKSVEDYGPKNNTRMEAYHRADVSIQFLKQKKWGVRTWSVDVYNIYNRKNPFFYYYDTKTVNDKTYGIVKKSSLFQIIPSITYSFKF